MSTLAAPLPHGPSSAADPAEGRRYGGAFRVSAALHLILLGLVVVLTMIVREKDADKPAIFELVAGEGDNFLALDAPSGSEAGRAAEGEIEFTSPDPVPVWTPPAPAAAEPEPAAPTPVTPGWGTGAMTPLRGTPACWHDRARLLTRCGNLQGTCLFDGIFGCQTVQEWLE
jgi:colicin import membrane protein